MTAETALPEEGRAPNPPPSKRLLIYTAAAAAAGLVIVLGAVLPAEFNRDPLGIGRVSGLSRLWAPREVELAPTAGDQPLAREYPVPYRSDVIDIRLAESGHPERLEELEYKVRMNKDATLVYSWSVGDVEDPEWFYYDFHGHTVPAEGSGEEMVVSTYKQDTGTSQNGSLVAPFDGIQGWFFQNQTEHPVTVRLRVSGFYELIPPGEEGNLNGFLPVGAEPQSAAPG